MKNEGAHVSDQDLLLFADGETGSGRAALICEHLSDCRRCSTRLAEIETTIADLNRVHRERFDPHLPPVAGSRASLKIRMAEEIASPQRFRLARLAMVFFRSPFAYAGAVLFIAVLGLTIIRYRPLYQPAERPLVQVSADPVPNRNLTPGAIHPVTQYDVCSAGRREMNRVVPTSVQQKVFKEYGLVGVNPKDYEIDYLITPELGGSNDIRNLWPEPYSATEWNAHVKDVLEDRFHQLVCDGKIDLATAQHAMASDWISAYKNYFQTEKPLSRHSYPSGEPSNQESRKESGNAT